MSVFVILVLGILFTLAFVLWKFVHTKTLDDMPFEKRRFFFTAKQRAFYQALQQSIGDKYIVFSRVSMAEVIRTSHGLSKKKRAAYVQKLQGVQVPFVLCEATSLVIVAGVSWMNKYSPMNRRLWSATLSRKYLMLQVYPWCASTQKTRMM